MAAITAILSRYPEQVITIVTHPATGLPSKKSWLPTIKEVTDACDDAVEPIVQNEARIKRIKEQMEMRERENAGIKPTIEQLKEKYGEHWGINQDDPDRKSAKPFVLPTWEQIGAEYSADPSRLARLLKSDLDLGETK